MLGKQAPVLSPNRERISGIDALPDRGLGEHVGQRASLGDEGIPELFGALGRIGPAHRLPEQAEVLRGMHAKEAVTKDSLYNRLRWDNAPQQAAMPQDATRVMQPPLESPGEVHTSEPDAQELSSSSAKQPPRKELRRERQAPPQPARRQEEWATVEDSDKELLISIQHRNEQQRRERPGAGPQELETRTGAEARTAGD
ncbi:hypothetical protein R1flu_021271 [Riccia fluitans]|uniref:Uncharacterized protein n=1 Tax=Riccia fluitans TaxID=41844 RepID=A0ABD1ZNX4_9MARC